MKERKENIHLKEVFEVEPEKIYHAWLDSDLHSRMTGGQAQCSNQVGHSFMAWDGYITGKNLELFKNRKIVQTWRTSEFDEKDDDSILTITLNQVSEGTEIILNHTNIPAGQTQYAQGWVDHYFSPMKAFFGK